MLISGIQQSDSFTYFFSILSMTGSYKILEIVPCDTQQTLVVYLYLLILYWIFQSPLGSLYCLSPSLFIFFLWNEEMDLE